MENTTAVLDFLGRHAAVAWVTHPNLPSHPDHALAKRLLPRGAGSMVSFGVKGGRAAGKKFIDTLRLASHLANVGDAKTLVMHPATTTHQQMSAAQLEAALAFVRGDASVTVERSAATLEDVFISLMPDSPEATA